MITSISSLLHFANSREHAAKLFSMKKKFQFQMKIWDVLNHYLINLSKLLKLESADYKDKSIEDIDPNKPLITCLCASDGKEDHTVTIYKKWIFDGNFNHALPLNQESLDICCSSDEKKCLYEFMLHT